MEIKRKYQNSYTDCLCIGPCFVNMIFLYWLERKKGDISFRAVVAVVVITLQDGEKEP